jgi:WS/DGAT/MGAT family acyltransferase
MSPATAQLSPLDASFLYLERTTEPLHVGSVVLLDGAVSLEALRVLLGARLGALPRYRQRPVRPAFDLRPPAWEDDPDFDPGRHVRRIVVPAPGGEAELHSTVDMLFTLPFDRRRPLWQAFLLDGLAGGRSAVLSKVHHCMIDGISGAQVMELMTDASPAGEASAPPDGERVSPGDGGAPASYTPVRRALAAMRSALATAADPAGTIEQIRHAMEAAGTLVALARAPLPALPLNGPLSGERRIVWATFALDDLLAMRGAAACKVNDVVLAIITGALRRWLASRNALRPGTAVRTLVPVSLRGASERLTLGNRVSAMIATLPVDVADPIARLARIAEETRRLKERGQPQAFGLMLSLAGTLPSALAPVMAGLTSRFPLVNTVCTNVPGPLDVRYLLGRRVLEMHPIVPISLGMGAGFAILSYAGTVSIAANADPRLVPDAESLPSALTASAAELAASLGLSPAPAPVAAATGPTVADLMTAEVVTVGPGDSLAIAWEMMRAHRIRHLPVIGPRGDVVGLVTHRDLLGASQSTLAFRSEAERVRLLSWARVGEVMETHLGIATPDEPAAAAGTRMARHKIGCLPVVGPAGRLAGIVTQEDFLRWATSHMATSAA